MAKNEVDDLSGVETTGHDWDGIKELNNPLPRWWLWTFYACIAFSIGYVVYYPAIPLIERSTVGVSGVTNRSSLKQEMAAVAASKAASIDALEKKTLSQIASDPELYRFAISGGASLYKVNCSQCHGSGAQGAPGYPNLNDDDWLWGGHLEAIYTSIKHGIRNQDDEDARTSLMPGFGDGALEPKQISDVAQYVLRLSQQDADVTSASRGAAVFVENCAECHGLKGQGNRELGGPNLSDALWLYGGTAKEIETQILKPKHGVMPAWGKRLSEAAVKQLTLYVHSLGGGEKTPPGKQAAK